MDLGKLGEFAFASRKFPEYMHHRLLLCRTCDLVFASPVPDVSELHAAYEAAAFDSQVEAQFAARTYARLLRPHWSRLPDKQGALDIGTGDGAFLKELLAAGFQGVLGIEPSLAPIMAASAPVRGLIQQGLFGAGQFAPQSLSLVTCFQTIEHVSNPRQLCTEACRLLKPGGVLCLVGHSRRALSAQLMGTKSPIFDIEHLQLFSPASFHRLLASAGLMSIRVASFWNRYPVAYWTRLFPLPTSLKNLSLKLMAATGLGHLTIPLPAGNLVAIGFKPSEHADL
jgi:SAM-dependent methyltransferase